ncbi:TetR/AcrR family transcriptional regulator [Caulobacter mirabilis]|uniref:TetR/AcrR family transcriptional regulator n=1 Tax=Caulobacter mirabilis TaxID=69666 RepID=UPI00155900EC|nr:TetR/AcrR family transcriptional regulator [Caulobacter mirabilis]
MTGTVRRFTTADWLGLGLAALAEAGPPALTIEALCQRAGKTKGSFYAHFAGSEAYLAALAEHWRERHTRRLVEAARAEDRADAQLSALDQLALRLDERVEQGMRRLAAVDETVRRVCAEVDRERIAYLAELHQVSGRFDAADAQALARLEYAAFVGFQQIDTGAGEAGAAASYALFLKLTGRA